MLLLGKIAFSTNHGHFKTKEQSKLENGMRATVV